MYIPIKKKNFFQNFIQELEVRKKLKKSSFTHGLIHLRCLTIFNPKHQTLFIAVVELPSEKNLGNQNFSSLDCLLGNFGKETKNENYR